MVLHPGQRTAARRIAVALSLLETLVVITIIIVLLAILIPHLRITRMHTRRMVCAHNERQWGHAAQFYRYDYNDYIPTEGTYFDLEKPYTWFNELPPYLGLPRYIDIEGQGQCIRECPELSVWICPAKNKSYAYKSHSGKNQFHYGMNQVLDGMGEPPYGGSTTPGFPDQGDLPLEARKFASKPNTVLLFDILPNSPAGCPKDVATEFHRDYFNVLYLSGRVDHFRRQDIIRDADSLYPSIVWRHPQLYWGYTPPWSP
jgi:hypothetical protein